MESGPAKLPKSYLVRTELERIIDELSVGDSVPAERELASRFGVSRETVRQAVHELWVEGRIGRVGRGTVVAHPKVIQVLSLRSDGIGDDGRVVVTWEEATAAAVVATALQIPVGAAVLHLERVLVVDGHRIGLASTWLPSSRFTGLRETFDPTSSLRAAIRATGTHPRTAVERLETVLPTPREASLLEATTALPVLLLHRVSRDDHDAPVETTRALYRGDRVAFETTLRD